jgi:hypothetical protein
MRASMVSAGETLDIGCEVGWVTDLIREGTCGELREATDADASILIRVESSQEPFDVAGWEPLTRGAWVADGSLVIADPCTAGFDVRVSCTPHQAKFNYRWRPPRRTHAAALVLRSRFHLLARAVLMQFPALWWAGRLGRAPLHASAVRIGNGVSLLAGPGGVGKSTLLAAVLEAGGRATGDNLCVGDGMSAWGLLEPMRIEAGTGRRMPHGRREAPMPGRIHALAPDRVVVVRRGSDREPILIPCDQVAAARSLATGTYMAGELRRFWGFAATLAAGTGIGPSHPPVGAVSAAFAQRLPCLELILPGTPSVGLSDLLVDPGVSAWT